MPFLTLAGASGDSGRGTRSPTQGPSHEFTGDLLVTTGVATSFQADWLLGRPVWGSSCLLPPGTVFLVSGSWPHPTISLPPHKSPVTWSHPRHKVRRVPHHTPPWWGQRNRTVPGDTASDRHPAGVRPPLWQVYHRGLATTGWGPRFPAGSVPTVLRSGQLRPDTWTTEPEKDTGHDWRVLSGHLTQVLSSTARRDPLAYDEEKSSGLCSRLPHPRTLTLARVALLLFNSHHALRGQPGNSV